MLTPLNQNGQVFVLERKVVRDLSRQMGHPVETCKYLRLVAFSLELVLLQQANHLFVSII